MWEYSKFSTFLLVHSNEISTVIYGMSKFKTKLHFKNNVSVFNDQCILLYLVFIFILLPVCAIQFAPGIDSRC